eukprot:jgi/Mesen1/6833/ME000351S05948
MGAGLVAVVDRDLEGKPVLDAQEGETLSHIEPNVGIALGDAEHKEMGTLYITTKRLVWLSGENPQKGYGVDFLSLTMHAISRDSDAYPQPCIYTQIESDEIDEELEEGYEEDNEGDEDDIEGAGEGGSGGGGQEVTMGGSEEGTAAVATAEAGGEEENLALVSEMRLIPHNPEALDQMFKALCSGAALNPDPAGALAAMAVVERVWPLLEDKGEGEWYYNADEVAPIGAASAGGLGDPSGNHHDSAQVEMYDSQRFEDAEEDEEDEDEDASHQRSN